MHKDKRNLGRGHVHIFSKKAFRQKEGEETEAEDKHYKHIRNKFIRKAIEALRQARRCEQFAFRLELKTLGKGKAVHTELNKHAIFRIVKECGQEEHFDVELADKLTDDIDRQAENTMLRPMLKRCAEK